MEAMAPYIAKQDRIVAAFIVGIAMKESKFGVYAPHKRRTGLLSTTGDTKDGKTRPLPDIPASIRPNTPFKLSEKRSLRSLPGEFPIRPR